MLCVYANGEIINENNVSATMSPRQCFLVVGGGHILTFCFHTVFFFSRRVLSSLLYVESGVQSRNDGADNPGHSSSEEERLLHG